MHLLCVGSILLGTIPIVPVATAIPLFDFNGNSPPSTEGAQIGTCVISEGTTKYLCRKMADTGSGPSHGLNSRDNNDIPCQNQKLDCGLDQLCIIHPGKARSCDGCAATMLQHLGKSDPQANCRPTFRDLGEAGVQLPPKPDAAPKLTSS